MWYYLVNGTFGTDRYISSLLKNKKHARTSTMKMRITIVHIFIMMTCMIVITILSQRDDGLHPIAVRQLIPRDFRLQEISTQNHAFCWLLLKILYHICRKTDSTYSPGIYRGLFLSSGLANEAKTALRFSKSNI